MMILFILSNYIYVICYLLDIKIYIDNIDVVMSIDYSQLIRSKQMPVKCRIWNSNQP